MKIFLDDERRVGQVTWVDIPVGPWTTARNYNTFKQLLDNAENIEFVSFDHDLGYEHYGHGLNDDEIPYDSYTEKTGLHCAHALVDWCINNNKPLPNYEVHSMNPVGAANIRSLLENFRKSQ